jgi:hypothetical protein
LGAVFSLKNSGKLMHFNHENGDNTFLANICTDFNLDDGSSIIFQRVSIHFRNDEAEYYSDIVVNTSVLKMKTV